MKNNWQHRKSDRNKNSVVFYFFWGRGGA